MTLDRYLFSTKTTSRQFAFAMKVSIFAVHKWRRRATIPRIASIKTIERLTKGRVKPQDWYA